MTVAVLLIVPACSPRHGPHRTIVNRLRRSLDESDIRQANCTRDITGRDTVPPGRRSAKPSSSATSISWRRMARGAEACVGAYAGESGRRTGVLPVVYALPNLGHR